MSSRSSQPALYEKIRIREGLLGPSPKVDVPLLPPSEADDGSWTSQGHSLHVPVGVLFIAGAAIIALVAFAFMMGHRQGYGVARAESEDGFLAGTSTGRGGETIRTLDPPGDPSGKSPNVLYQAPAAAAPTKATEPAKAQSRPRSQWGPVISKPDPRKKGLTYFVLAETNETGAAKLAEFCRNSGLETYVVPSKNDRLRRVVAFPGFEAGSRSKPEVKALEAFIHSIGEKWAKAERGGSNLHDAYPSPY